MEYEADTQKRRFSNLQGIAQRAAVYSPYETRPIHS